MRHGEPTNISYEYTERYEFYADPIQPYIASTIHSQDSDDSLTTWFAKNETYSNEAKWRYPQSWEIVKTEVENAHLALGNGSPNDATKHLYKAESLIGLQRGGYSEMDLIRTNSRIQMEMAIVARVTGDNNLSENNFERALATALQNKDIPLLIELQRHRVNFGIARGLYDWTVLKAIESITLADVTNRHGDQGWLSKGLYLAIQAHPRIPTIQVALKYLWISGYLRSGAVQLFKQKFTSK